MIKQIKKYTLSCLLLFLMPWLSITGKAVVPDFMTISGPSKIAVGKPDLEYSVYYYINGSFTLINFDFVVWDGDDLLSQSNSEHQLHLYFNAPTHEGILAMTAVFDYKDANGADHRLMCERNLKVQKPFLQALRTGLNGVVYNNNDTAVPIHWNIDDDDRDAGDLNNYYGMDCKQITEMSCADNDLYCVNAWITNDLLNTSQCNFKIKTPESMRLWFTQNKSSLCCDSNSVYETTCDIKTWFNNNANSTGNRLYVEWIVSPDTTTNEYVEFYCNDVQFAKLRYKGYALTHGALPNKAERIYFEDRCELDGCEWRIAPGGGTHEHDRNSLAEAVDPNFTKYGEPFVATTSSPYGTNVYVLQDSIYNTFLCRCISMDTFGNQNHVFEDSDATAFFTRQYFWTYNYCNYSMSVPFSDILYYSGQFAATKVPSSWAINCHPSWAMFTSRFFNRPKIIHRAEQLEATRTIQKTYVKELP
ncbi:hypothetical protein IKW72_05605 [bacterium]|nr:hypothetical protein [bacterium]